MSPAVPCLWLCSMSGSSFRLPLTFRLLACFPHCQRKLFCCQLPGCQTVSQSEHHVRQSLRCMSNGHSFAPVSGVWCLVPYAFQAAHCPRIPFSCLCSIISISISTNPNGFWCVRPGLAPGLRFSWSPFEALHIKTLAHSRYLFMRKALRRTVHKSCKIFI